jgi:hypothetical protein
MIEEGEFMVARQRREPERELGEINCARIFVDAIKTTLSDETPGMKLVILVFRNLRPCFRPTFPCLDEPLAKRTANLSNFNFPTTGCRHRASARKCWYRIRRLGSTLAMARAR